MRLDRQLYLSRNVIFVMLLVLSIACSCADAADISQQEQMQLIKSRILRAIVDGTADLPTTPAPDDDLAAVKKHLADLRDDGSWADIDYQSTQRSAWPAGKHLFRMRELARFAKNETSPLYDDPKLLEAAYRALSYWLRNDFTSTNWFPNQIGVPMNLAPTALMLDDMLTPDQWQQVIEILRRAQSSGRPRGGTGANGTWFARICVILALCTDDANLLRRSVANITSLITDTQVDGIQKDNSFFQHGQLLYSLGYGSSFLFHNSRLASYFHETDYAFPEGKIDMLTNMALDGTQWFTHGTSTDFAAEGREIASPTNQQSYFLRAVALSLLQSGAPREGELRDLVKRIDDRQSAPLIGNRLFWVADTMVHKRKDYHVSVRACSKRTYNSEQVNQEGVKSWFVGYGATTILQSGKELTNIFPLWDWTKIPGTTAFDGESPTKVRGETVFSGGASDGMYGVYGYDFQLTGLAAKKAWFFFDDEVVALGAGITDALDREIFTTINQCWSLGDVSVRPRWSANTRTLTEGMHRFQAGETLSHGGLNYVFPEPISIAVRKEYVKGDWNTIFLSMPSLPTEGETVTLWVEHSKNPTNATYAYIIDMSKRSPECVDSMLKNVRIVKNTPQIQAVWHASLQLGGVVFHEPGTVDLAPGVSVQSDKPCFMLVREADGGVQRVVGEP